MKRRRTPYLFRGKQGKKLIKIMICAAVGLAALIVIIALLTRKPFAYDSPEVKTVEANGVLRVGVRNDIKGLSYGMEGLEIEIAKRLAAAVLPDMPSEYALELVEVNTKTFVARLDDNSLDMAVCMMRKDGYSDYVYSSAYYTDKVYVAVKEGNRHTDINKMTVGYVNKTPGATAIKNFIGDPKAYDTAIRAYASYPELLDALTRDEIDGAVLQGTYFMTYKDKYALLKHDMTVGKIDYAIACSTDSPALIEIANRMLYDMQKSGELDALIVKFNLEKSSDG